MVDRVDSRYDKPPTYRVNEARDALEDDKKNGGQDAEEEGQSDNFDKLKDKADLQALFDKNNLWKRNDVCPQWHHRHKRGVILKNPPSGGLSYNHYFFSFSSDLGTNFGHRVIIRARSVTLQK